MKDISYETHTNKDHNVTKDKKGKESKIVWR